MYAQYYKMVANGRQQGSQSRHSGEFKFQILPPNCAFSGAEAAPEYQVNPTPTEDFNKAS